MNFTKHPSNNLSLGAPAGHDQSTVEIYTLPATLTEQNGVPFIQSFWLPSEAELSYLERGAPLVLSIMGTTMPPVAVEVEALQSRHTTPLDNAKAELEVLRKLCTGYVVLGFKSDLDSPAYISEGFATFAEAEADQELCGYWISRIEAVNVRPFTDSVTAPVGGAV